MFSKLALLILSFGVVGGGLLATRQLRIQAAHELADVQRRVNDHDRQLWELRVEIARRALPEQVASKLRTSEEGAALAMEPIGPHRYAQFVQREAEASLMLASDTEEAPAKPAPKKSRNGTRKPVRASRKIAAASRD